MDLNTLRSSRNNDFSKITQEFEKAANPKSYADDRIWKLEPDKAGNATATIRFLARTEGDELPWVKMFNHGFQGPTGRWFIEECLTTLEKDCPCCEENSTLWNSVTDDKHPVRDQVRKQKRKLSYVSNILVINDPKHPENNGKVFLFKFGKKIFDKIMDKARPTFEDQEPVNVFDYWMGANFKIRMKKVDGFFNYDSSEFELVAPVAPTDEGVLAIANAQYKLHELTAPNKYKTYDELKNKLMAVMAGTPVSSKKAEDFVSPVMTAPPIPSVAPVAPKSVAASGEDEDSDMMSYFQNLANSDDDAPF